MTIVDSRNVVTTSNTKHTDLGGAVRKLKSYRDSDGPAAPLAASRRMFIKNTIVVLHVSADMAMWPVLFSDEVQRLLSERAMPAEYV